jgi:hypothetical protein
LKKSLAKNFPALCGDKRSAGGERDHACWMMGMIL